MKKLISVFLSLTMVIAMLSILASADENDIFTYKVSGTEATITAVNHDGMKNIVIPEEIDGYTVTGISGIETVFSFGTENMVESLYIPKTVTKTDAGSLGYFDCAKFIVDEDNPSFSSDEHGVLFNKDKTTLVRVPCSLQESSYTIPGSVTEIESRALETCLFLQHIDFPTGITSIGNQTCMQMISLESVEIPEGVTKIDQNAFAQCYSLRSVSLPDSLTEMYNGCFTECTSLEYADIPEGVTEIQMYAFESDESLKYVTIPASVKTIGRGVFGNCSSLADICYTGSEEEWSSITTATGNTELQNAVIHYDFDLSEYDNIELTADGEVLFISGSGEIKSAGEEDWHYWDARKDEVTTIITGPEITGIGSYAFDGFTKAELVVIQGENTAVGEYAFGDCGNLRDIITEGNADFDGTALTGSDNASVLTCGTVTGVDDSRIIKYSFGENTLKFENHIDLGKDEFINIITVMAEKGGFDSIAFTSAKIDGLSLYYTDENGEEKAIDGGVIEDGIMTVTHGSNPITFNELVEKIAADENAAFRLMVTDRNHPAPGSEDSGETTEETTEEPDSGNTDDNSGGIRKVISITITAVQNAELALLKGVKWAVNLINKLIKYIRK